GLVVAVVVDAVECHSLGPLAHVGKEDLETARPAPPLAHRDAATAVAAVRMMVRVEAATLHCAPGRIRRATSAPARVRVAVGPVCRNAPSLQLCLQAPAGSRRAVWLDEERSVDHDHTTARASRAPSRLP